MPELNDVLAAFELTLNLERELGMRVLEFDRSILAAPKVIDSKPNTATPQKTEERRIVSSPFEKKVEEVEKPVPQERPVEVKSPAILPPKVNEPINIADISESGNSDSPDFIFAVETSRNEEAEVLFRRMVEAMGYADLDPVYTLRLPPITRGDAVLDEGVKRVSEIVKKVSPKAIVLFGSSVTPYFFPRELVRKGLSMYTNIPVMVTNSPVRILRSNTPTNAVKRETWGALQLILSIIGKVPPQNKK
jgi:hypothetical protein